MRTALGLTGKPWIHAKAAGAVEQGAFGTFAATRVVGLHCASALLKDGVGPGGSLSHSVHEASMRNVAKAAAPLSLEDEHRLGLRASGGCAESFERLVRAHLRLVLAIARDYRRFGLPLEDLIAEGTLGLVEATRRYEPARGVRLATYAEWWIRGYVGRYTMANRRIVRPSSSRSARKLLAHLRTTQHRLAQSGEADANAVASVLDVRVDEIQEIEAVLSGRDVPIDDPSISIASEALTPEAKFAEEEVQQRVHASLQRAVNALNDRQRFLVTERYLNGDNPPVSLAAVARTLGLSRERARQIEHAARNRLRQMIPAA